MNIWKLGAAVLVSAALAACGGGGGSPGNNGTGGDSQDARLGSLELSLDKTTIVNSGNDVAVLTVTALDRNRGTLEEVPVSISLSPDGVFRRVTTEPATDSNGRFVAEIGIGANKENRVINIEVRSGNVTRLTSIQVTGTQISVTPLPATPMPSEPVSFTLSVRDSANQPIPNARLTLSGTFGLTGEVTTNLAGDATIPGRAAPAASGDYTVVVSGLGVTSSQTVTVGSARPGAVGPIVSRSLTPTPSRILTNSTGSTTNRSQLIAQFLTTGNAPIPNLRVRFELIGDVLGAGEFISTGNSIVFTNNAGVATSDYVAGTRSSQTNGVRVRACYDLVDFPASSCPNQVEANLTVGGNPVSITIGENNELRKGLGNLTYIRQHIVQVVDASGVAVNDAVVSVSLDVTHYGKGPVWNQPYAGFTALQAPLRRDIHPDYTPSPLPAGALATLQPSTSVPTTSNFWCINEDQDRNGFVGPGEDVNNNGTLEPRQADVAVSFPSGNRTNSNGQLLVEVTYPQNVGRWLAYTLRATTSVQGSEGDVSKGYVTDVLQADVANGSFLTPPYGSGSCRQSN